MNGDKNFKDFKQALIDANEKKYGGEIRKKYGGVAVEKSNVKLMGLTREQYDEGERLRDTLEKTLVEAFKTGDPSGERAAAACDLHKKWLGLYGHEYTVEYHKNLGEMYADDERFRSYYDRLAPGCAEFFRDAINIYCDGSK